MTTRCVPELSVTSPPSENDNRYASPSVVGQAVLDAADTATTPTAPALAAAASSAQNTSSTVAATPASNQQQAATTPSAQSTTSVSYTNNPNTTRSWPVIYRNPCQYDYDALYAINNNNNNSNYNCSSTDELSNEKYNDSNFIYERARSQSVFHSYKMQPQNQAPVSNANDTQTSTGGCCNIGPTPTPVIFLFVTLLMTTSATAMLCAAIMTDHWEHVTWDRTSLDKLANESSTHNLHWLLDGRVARLPIKSKYK